MKEKCTSTTTALIYAHSFFLKKNSTFYINLSPHLRGQRKTLTCPLTSPTRPKKASSSPLAFSGEPRLPRLPPPARPHPIFLPPISLSLARPLESSTDRIPRGSSAAILRRRRAQASGQDRIASCLYLASVSFLFIYLFFSFAFLLSMGRAWNRSRSLFFFCVRSLVGHQKSVGFLHVFSPPNFWVESPLGHVAPLGGLLLLALGIFPSLRFRPSPNFGPGRTASPPPFPFPHLCAIFVSLRSNRTTVLVAAAAVAYKISSIFF